MSNVFEITEALVKNTDEIVDKLDDKLFDKLNSTRRDVREKALRVIISWIDIETPYWLSILNFLPISLSRKKGSETALSFLEALSLIWEHLDIEIIKKVYLEAVVDIEDANSEWDQDYISYVTNKIDLLLSMGEKNSYYWSNSEFYSMMWSEYERRGMLYEAIIAYNKMIEIWDKNWYLWTAMVYRKLWYHNVAIKMLEQWFELYSDLRFLDRLVRMYVEIWDIIKAKEIYAKMLILHNNERELLNQEKEEDERLSNFREWNNKSSWWSYDILFERWMKKRDLQKEEKEIEKQFEDKMTDILPFAFYSNRIEHDRELEEIEYVITKYFFTNELIPTDSFKSTVNIASEYVWNEIDKLNKRFKILQNIGFENLDDEWTIEYKNIVLRRLFLSQIDLFWLRNSRYLDSYLVDIYWLTLYSWANWLEWLREHFESHYSIELLFEESWMELIKEERNVNKLQKTEDDDWAIDEIDDEESEWNWIYNIIWKHISLLSRLYFTWEFYETYRDRINPLIYWVYNEYPDFSDLDKRSLYTSILVLKSETDFFDSLRPEIIEMYNKLTLEIDNKYGLFYRRMLQCIARSNDYNDEEWIIEKQQDETEDSWNDEDKEAEEEKFEIPQGIYENPDLSVYFWIEKIIASNLPVKDMEWLGKLIEYYGLNLPWTLSYDEALAFWTFLWYANVDISIKYFLTFPDLLKNPHTIYNLLEWIREMSRSEWKKVIKDLHNYFRKEYNVRWFFDFIGKTFNQLSSSWDDLPEDYDIYMMLCLWDIAILKWEWFEKASMCFKVAIQYGSVESMIQLWDLYENNWYYDGALKVYEMAFNDDNNINTLTKILYLLIQTWKFNEAKSYLDAWISLWYELHQWVFSYLLWSWKTEDAMKQLFDMLWKWILFQDIPIWTVDLFFDEMMNIVNKQDNHDKNLDKLKIWATYLQAIFFSWQNWAVSTYSVIEHWNNLESAMGDIEEVELYKFIESSLWDIIWEDVWFYKYIKINTWIVVNGISEFNALPLSTKALLLYSYHANSTFNKISKNYEESKVSMNLDEIRNNFKIVNNFIWRIIKTLNRFPWAENIINSWRKSVLFIVPWVKTDDESLASTMVH